MEDAEANFSEPIAFELIWKDDYKEFQYTEKAKVEKTAWANARKCFHSQPFILSEDLIFSNVKMITRGNKQAIQWSRESPLGLNVLPSITRLRPGLRGLTLFCNIANYAMRIRTLPPSEHLYRYFYEDLGVWKAGPSNWHIKTTSDSNVFYHHYYFYQ